MKSRKQKNLAKEQEPETFETIIEAAFEFLERGERYNDGETAKKSYDKAAEHFERALAVKQDADALYNCGRVYLLLSEPTLLEKERLLLAAIHKFEICIQLDDKSTDSMVNLALTLVSLAELYVLPAFKKDIRSQLDTSSSLLDRAFKVQIEQFEQLKKMPVESINDDTIIITPHILLETLFEHIRVLCTVVSVIDLSLLANVIKKKEALEKRCENIFSSQVDVPLDEDKTEFLFVKADFDVALAEAIHEGAKQGLLQSENAFHETSSHLKTAISLLDQILAVNPKVVRAICDKADSCFLLFEIMQSFNDPMAPNFLTESIELLKTASKLVLSPAPMNLKLGDIHLQIGDGETAVKFYESALRPILKPVPYLSTTNLIHLSRLCRAYSLASMTQEATQLQVRIVDAAARAHGLTFEQILELDTEF